MKAADIKNVMALGVKCFATLLTQNCNTTTVTFKPDFPKKPDARLELRVKKPKSTFT
jgi:hypothetical protein